MTPHPWQRPVWSVVATALREQRLGHALLISGPDLAGNRHFAGCITAALWCRTPEADGSGCARCPDCLQVASGSHSGYFVLGVAEGKRDIAIDQVRELSEKLSVTQHDGRAKVAIIDPADALNVNGVNALLKTIEEPTANSHLLLISGRPQALAATLRSRCQRLTIAAPDRDEALAWLAGQAGATTEADPARLAAALDHAFGAPVLAARLLDDGGLAQREAWAAQIAAFDTAGTDPLALAESFGREPAQAVAWLHWWYGWLHRALRERLDPAADGDALAAMPPAALDGYLAEVQAALAAIHGAADRRLLIESLLIGWLGLLARARRGHQNRRP